MLANDSVFLQLSHVVGWHLARRRGAKKTMLNKRRIVITGVGVLAANGIGKEEFWSSLIAGRSGVGPITLFDASRHPCQIAGEVKNFDLPKLLGRPVKVNYDPRLAAGSSLDYNPFARAKRSAGLGISVRQRANSIAKDLSC